MKLKVKVFDYEYGKNAKACGLEHGGETELTSEEIVALHKKCNIMLLTWDDTLLLCLDSGNFKQR